MGCKNCKNDCKKCDCKYKYVHSTVPSFDGDDDDSRKIRWLSKKFIDKDH
jgi:hypothetical protein